MEPCLQLTLGVVLSPEEHAMGSGLHWGFQTVEFTPF